MKMPCTQQKPFRVWKTKALQASRQRPEQTDDKRCRAINDMCQDDEYKKVTIQESDVVTSTPSDQY